MKLTDKECRALGAQEKPYKRADGQGLHLLIKPNGQKYWRMNYRFYGKHKTLAIGTYPDVSLKEARSQREHARKLLSEGLDPSYEKRKAKIQSQLAIEDSFQAIAHDWYETRTSQLSLKHRKRIKSVLADDIIPYIGKSPINSIQAPELLIALRKIEARGAFYTAERSRQWCSQIFRYAIACGKAERDIAHDLRGAIHTHQGKHMPYFREQELPTFFKALKNYRGRGPTALALLLLSQTFVRPNELSLAQKEEFILEKCEWRIPAERMKMRIEHIVPLSKQSMEVVQSLFALSSNSEYLLPSYKAHWQGMHPDTLLRALYRMGFKSQATAHGFRATASTILNENRFDRDLIEKQLAHTDKNKVRAAYNHAEYLQERRDMMQWWADHLDSLGANEAFKNLQTHSTVP